MTSINVHGDVGKVELLKGICDTILVIGLGCLASGQVGVGDQVGEGIRLDDKSNSDVWCGLDSGNNC